MAYTWGEQPQEDSGGGWFRAGFDLVLMSDLLAIAVIHGLYGELRAAMITACRPGSVTLFTYCEFQLALEISIANAEIIYGIAPEKR